MKVFAYTFEEHARAMQVVSGVTPLTSPPLTDYDMSLREALPRGTRGMQRSNLVRQSGDFSSSASFSITPALLSGYDLLIFCLHGLPDQPYWYNDRHATAICATTVRQSMLKGSVVFTGACHTPESPMLQAFLDAGAAAVIAGSGTNYYHPRKVGGFDRLAYHFRQIYALPLRTNFHDVWIERALTLAKYMTRAFNYSKFLQDTLQFKAYFK